MIIKSNKQLKISIITGISFLSLLSCVLIIVVGIIIYSRAIIGVKLIPEFGIIAFLLIISLLLLWIYSFCLVTRINIDDDGISLFTLFRAIGTDALRVRIRKDTDSFLYLKITSRETGKKKHLIVLKKYYDEKDLLLKCILFQ